LIKEALDGLVAAYRDLRRMLTRELGAEQAADLAQASVERVLAHGRVAAIRSPRAFLFQTARNLQVDHHRRTSCVR
jgi:RNA polymerase sigma-70 factor (ECF subfamily)